MKLLVKLLVRRLSLFTVSGMGVKARRLVRR